MQNFFKLFKLKPAFSIDQNQLQARYIKLQKQVHPDQSGSAELNISSAVVNQAYQTLKDPYQRVLHFLAIHQMPYDIEQVCIDSEFLMLQMDIRQTIENAKSTNSLEALDQLKVKIQSQLNECMQCVNQYIEEKQFTQLKALLPNWQFLQKAYTQIEQAILTIQTT